MTLLLMWGTSSEFQHQEGVALPAMCGPCGALRVFEVGRPVSFSHIWFVIRFNRAVGAPLMRCRTCRNGYPLSEHQHAAALRIAKRFAAVPAEERVGPAVLPLAADVAGDVLGDVGLGARLRELAYRTPRGTRSIVELRGPLEPPALPQAEPTSGAGVAGIVVGVFGLLILAAVASTRAPAAAAATALVAGAVLVVGALLGLLGTRSRRAGHGPGFVALVLCGAGLLALAVVAAFKFL